jgi:hypothetical protein
MFDLLPISFPSFLITMNYKFDFFLYGTFTDGLEYMVVLFLCLSPLVMG